MQQELVPSFECQQAFSVGCSHAMPVTNVLARVDEGHRVEPFSRQV